MTDRIRRFFLADPTGSPGGTIAGGDGRFIPPSPPAATVTGNAVGLASPRDAEVVAGGLAAGLRGGGRPVVACLWPPDDDAASQPPLPSFPAAARTADRLRSQGLVAMPTGLVALVQLDADAAIARAQVGRAEAVARGPVAVVLSRRVPALDALVTRAARVLLVADPNDELATLAFEQVRRLHRQAVRLPRPASPAARLRHRMGLAALRPATAERPPAPVRHGTAEHVS